MLRAVVGINMDRVYPIVFPCGVIGRVLDWALRSEQSPAVRALVTYFTVATSSGLLFVGIWFACERWTFVATNGSRWLLSILEEYTQKFWGSATSGASKPFAPVARWMGIITNHFAQLLSKFHMRTHSPLSDGTNSTAMRARLSDTEAQPSRDCAIYPEFDSPEVIPVVSMDNGEIPRTDYCSEKREFPDSAKTGGIGETRLLFQDGRMPNIGTTRATLGPPSINIHVPNARFKAVVRR
ncbi:unnamed protein product, partial [Rhizoctonia solani]